MTDSMPDSRPLQGGPHLGLLAAISTALLLSGVAASAAPGGTVPSPFGDSAGIREYFLTQSSAVLAGGVLAFGASVPLTGLRRDGERSAAPARGHRTGGHDRAGRRDPRPRPARAVRAAAVDARPPRRPRQ